MVPLGNAVESSFFGSMQAQVAVFSAAAVNKGNFGTVLFIWVHKVAYAKIRNGFTKQLS